MSGNVFDQGNVALSNCNDVPVRCGIGTADEAHFEFSDVTAVVF